MKQIGSNLLCILLLLSLLLSLAACGNPETPLEKTAQIRKTECTGARHAPEYKNRKEREL